MEYNFHSTFKSAKIKGDEWQIVLAIPATDGAIVADIANTCRDRLLVTTIETSPEITYGRNSDRMAHADEPSSGEENEAAHNQD